MEWLRSIHEKRVKGKLSRKDKCVFDFRKVEFLEPSHLTTLACLIEEYKIAGARIYFKVKKNSTTERFLKQTKFINYWDKNFNRDHCFISSFQNILPIWHYQEEKINPFADLAQQFYSTHSLQGKDLTPLRISVVEALNNIKDHSNSKIGGFVFTQYFKNTSIIIISICDFGVGIPNKVNQFLKANGLRQLEHNDALEKALQLKFTTRSTPSNGGYGLDTILSHIKTTDGEIKILSNKAFFSKKIKNSKTLKTINDSIDLSFSGTFLEIRLNSSHFLPEEDELPEEMNLI